MIPQYVPPKFEADWVRPSGMLGSAIAREAELHAGKRYVHGTAGPDTFDCSGFTHFVVKRATGRVLPRSSYEYNRLPSSLAIWVEGSPLPGDILLFDSEQNGTIGHVGIMLGDGKMMTALGPGYGVLRSDPWGAYFAPLYRGAIRVV